MLPDSRIERGVAGGWDKVFSFSYLNDERSGENEKGFISFAARKSAGRRTGLTAAKVMKPCSELNRRRRVGL
jgi:hypothetical protein